MSDLKITVCGVGNAGMAIAADVSMMGFEVNVFEVPEFSSNLDPIKEKQGIQLTGNTVSKKTGLAKLNVITDNAKEAVDGVDLIMVSVPAPAHENVLKQIIPHLQEGQTVLFNTGYWSSIRFNHLLEEAGILNKVTFVESNIMPYLSGIVGPAEVHIYNYKNLMKVSAWPASKNEDVYKMLSRIYPQFKLADNIIETNFYPGNISVHAQIVLPKAEFFFDRAKEFRFYNEVSESASVLADKFDVERDNVARGYGCETINFIDWVKSTYEFEGDNLFEMYMGTENAKRWGHISGIYRVLEEDLCYGFIPLEEFAKNIGVDVPITTAMIELLTVFAGVNYREKAVTMKDLGLEGKTKEEILEFLHSGN